MPVVGRVAHGRVVGQRSGWEVLKPIKAVDVGTCSGVVVVVCSSLLASAHHPDIDVEDPWAPLVYLTE